MMRKGPYTASSVQIHFACIPWLLLSSTYLSLIQTDVIFKLIFNTSVRGGWVQCSVIQVRLDSEENRGHYICRTFTLTDQVRFLSKDFLGAFLSHFNNTICLQCGSTRKLHIAHFVGTVCKLWWDSERSCKCKSQRMYCEFSRIDKTDWVVSI